MPKRNRKAPDAVPVVPSRPDDVTILKHQSKVEPTPAPPNRDDQVDGPPRQQLPPKREAPPTVPRPNAPVKPESPRKGPDKKGPEPSPSSGS
jgi:hypothetical protein